MGRHYGCRAPRKANRLRRQLKRGPKLAPHHRGTIGKQVWNFSEVALFRMKQNKSLKAQKRQLKVKINALALSKRFYSMKRSSEDRWNQLGLHLWNAESLEEQKFLETEPQHAARGGLDMTCPVEIMAAMNANDTALCPCKSKRCKCRRNLDDDHKNEQIHQDLSKLKEYQGLLDEMLDYEDQMELAGKKATVLWFDEFKERLWRGPSLKNTFFKREFFAHLQQSISTESVRTQDCHQIQAFLEGGGAEHMLDSTEWEKFLRRLVWVLCSEPVELQGRCSKRQRMQFRDNQGGPPKPNQRPGLARKAHFGAGCYELVKYIQGRFAAHLTPNSLKDPKEIQEQKHHASFMASHRDLAKLNGMQEQLKAHVEIGASKMTGKKEDKKDKKYSSSKAKAGVTSASKSTTKGKRNRMLESQSLKSLENPRNYRNRQKWKWQSLQSPKSRQGSRLVLERKAWNRWRRCWRNLKKDLVMLCWATEAYRRFLLHGAEKQFQSQELEKVKKVVVNWQSTSISLCRKCTKFLVESVPSISLVSCFQSVNWPVKSPWEGFLNPKHH